MQYIRQFVNTSRLWSTIDILEGVLAAVAAAQADGSTTGAIRFEGQMIDEPVLERARRILSRVADEPKPTLARTPHRGEGGS